MHSIGTGFRARSACVMTQPLLLASPALVSMEAAGCQKMTLPRPYFTTRLTRNVTTLDMPTAYMLLWKRCLKAFPQNSFPTMQLFHFLFHFSHFVSPLPKYMESQTLRLWSQAPTSQTAPLTPGSDLGPRVPSASISVSLLRLREAEATPGQHYSEMCQLFL